MMKKVGIVTFHSTNNYGAALQCYALQKALEKINFDSYVINYTANMLKRPYGITALKEKGIIRFILGNLYSLLRSFRNKNFSIFRRKIKQTDVIKNDDLQKLNDEFDCFITGSDQVWNGTITSYDPVYFLRFVQDKHRRKSYAASFGMNTIPEEKKALYKELLDKFDIYNVREESGIGIIEDLLDKEANQTIDPTLLLNRNDWDCVTKDPIKNEKYIFVYQISPSKNLSIIVNELRKETGLRVFAIPFIMGKPVKHNMILNAGPSEWLGYLKNAEYVVTDSFHGTAFSTIFNKKFISCVPQNESRISSFLRLVNLEKRIVSGTELPSYIDDIDFGEANSIIQKEREKGLHILECTVGND